MKIRNSQKFLGKTWEKVQRKLKDSLEADFGKTIKNK